MFGIKLSGKNTNSHPRKTKNKNTNMFLKNDFTFVLACYQNWWTNQNIFVHFFTFVWNHDTKYIRNLILLSYAYHCLHHGKCKFDLLIKPTDPPKKKITYLVHQVSLSTLSMKRQMIFMDDGVPKGTPTWEDG